MTRILWLSKYQVSKDQIAELENQFGKVEIVDGPNRVNSVQDIIDLRDLIGVQEVVVWTSDSILAQLTDTNINKGNMPIRPVMYKKVEEDGSSELKHSHFERIEGVEVIANPLAVS